MPVLNEERVRNFLKGIGEGVEGASPEEFFGFLITVVLFVVITLVIQRRSDLIRRRRKVAASERLYNERLESLLLPPSGIRLVSMLAEEMKDDDKSAEIHLLFTEAPVYDRYAKILTGRDLSLAKPLRTLKAILGLGRSIPGLSLESTRELSEGQSVNINGSGPYRVIAINEERFVLSGSPEITGITAVVSWQSRASYYEAVCEAANEENTRAVFFHGNIQSKKHRRRFIRTKCSLDCVIETGERIPAKITDISAGGFLAKLGPDVQAAFSDEAESIVRIRLPGGFRLEAKACAVQSSEKGIHFQFTYIRPGDQDRIAKLVLSQQMKNAVD